LEASTIPSLYTAFIGEIEGEGIFADAALEPYSRQWREPPSKTLGGSLARRRSIRGTRSIAGAGCEWLKHASIGFRAFEKDV